MNNKSDVIFYAVMITLSLLLVQYGLVVFLFMVGIDFVMWVPYESWQLIGKIIVLAVTIIFYYLYKKTDPSKGRKITYKVYMVGFIIFSVEIGAFYGWLYLIGF